jgi:hypothetical protein
LQVNFLCLLVYLKTNRISPVFLGIMQALAVFGHLVNGLFGVVALWFFIAKDKKNGLRAFGLYALTAGMVIAAAFGTALTVIKPASGHEAWLWLLGSAGGPQGLAWHGSWWTREGIRAWLQMSVRILGSLQDQRFALPPELHLAGVFLTAASLFLGILLGFGMAYARDIVPRHKTVMGACLLWLGLYAVVFSSWEPYTMVYRVSDLIPFLILMALISRELWRGVGHGLALALAITLGLGNFGAEIYPRSFWTNNASWRTMQMFQTATEPNAWIAGNEGSDNIYIAYFAQRRPLVLDAYRDRPDELVQLLTRIARAHEPIYVESGMLDQPFWQAFFRGYTLTPVGSKGEPILLRVSGRELL